MNASPKNSVLVVGPQGVIGGAVSGRLRSSADWAVTGVSRRSDGPPHHIAADLLNPNALDDRPDLGAITHVVYAAYLERPTAEETVVPNVAMLRNVLEALRTHRAPLERVVLIGGGKSYGEHLGPYKSPAKESDPRFLGPIFYNDQEDLLRERAKADGFSYTILRPDAAIGFALGSPMNLLGAIGVFAALCKWEGVPMRFPGSPATWTALHQLTDTDLLAAAVEWALTSSNAADDVFNVTNGDNFRWEHLWGEIAEVFDLPTAPPQPMSLEAQLGGRAATWDRIVAKHGLVPTPFTDLAAWSFADAIFTSGFDMVQSTIKIRQAGFAECIDTHQSVVQHLRRLQRERYIP